MRYDLKAPAREPLNEHSVICYDIETIVDDEPTDGSFPPWPRHRPVAAAFLRARWHEDQYRFSLRTLTCRLGEEMTFYTKIEDIFSQGTTGVTYNGAGFDNRVLGLQMMRHTPGASMPGLTRQVLDGRWSGAHVDLADSLAHFGATRPVALAEICHALDIPVKTSASGADVGALWRAGEHRRIHEYVREDVIATYLVWLHYIAHIRGNEAKMMLPLADLATFIEGEPRLQHLTAFTTCRPAQLARTRAVELRAERANVAQERLRQRQRDEADFADGEC